MPLVDYGSSDEDSESDFNQEESDLKEINVMSYKTLKDDKLMKDEGNLKLSHDFKSVNEPLISETKLFSSLPTPKSYMSLGDDALKLLYKNRNQPVKILLPSLNDLELEDNKEKKKIKPSAKGSGLFALLPPPKTGRSLVPKAVQNKLNTNSKTKPVPLKKASVHVKPSVKFEEDENDHEDNPASFFFNSTDNDLVIPAVDIDTPAPCINKIPPVKVNDLSNPQPQLINTHLKNEIAIPSSSGNSYIQPMEITSASNLEDEAIEKLCGTRARKRKGEVPEEIIDFNVGSIVEDAYMWLSKDLSKEQELRSFKKAKNLSSTERRKHQITYLASQAKEKEMELRNQWSNSRMTRKQTQSKYGF